MEDSFCVLIDAPQHFDEAEELHRPARELWPAGVRIAILTHGHLDHTATLQVFSDALVTGTAATRKYIRGRGEQELERLRLHVAQGLSAGLSTEDLQQSVEWKDCSSKRPPPRVLLKYHKENIGKLVNELLG